MKHNLFDSATQQATLDRIRRLQPDTPRQWGQMTPAQVVCHMADPFREVLKLRQSKPAVPRIFQPLLRLIVLTEKDWKPNTPTLQAFRQGEGGEGTPPTDFESDKATLLALVDRFCAQPADFSFGRHPGVGQLSRDQNGFFLWKHTDHHLRQFGL